MDGVIADGNWGVNRSGGLQFFCQYSGGILLVSLKNSGNYTAYDCPDDGTNYCSNSSGDNEGGNSEAESNNDGADGCGNEEDRDNDGDDAANDGSGYCANDDGSGSYNNSEAESNKCPSRGGGRYGEDRTNNLEDADNSVLDVFGKFGATDLCAYLRDESLQNVGNSLAEEEPAGSTGDSSDNSPDDSPDDGAGNADDGSKNCTDQASQDGAKESEDCGTYQSFYEQAGDEGERYIQHQVQDSTDCGEDACTDETVYYAEPDEDKACYGETNKHLSDDEGQTSNLQCEHEGEGQNKQSLTEARCEQERQKEEPANSVDGYSNIETCNTEQH